MKRRQALGTLTASAVGLAALATGANASANLVFDFTGCPATARFSATMGISANTGQVTNTILRNNERI